MASGSSEPKGRFSLLGQVTELLILQDGRLAEASQSGLRLSGAHLLSVPTELLSGSILENS